MGSQASAEEKIHTAGKMAARVCVVLILSCALTACSRCQEPINEQTSTEYITCICLVCAGHERLMAKCLTS